LKLRRESREKVGVAVSPFSVEINQLEAGVGLLLIKRKRRSAKRIESRELVLRGLGAGPWAKASSALFLRGFPHRRPADLVMTIMALTVDVVRQVSEDTAHIGPVLHAPTRPRIVRAPLSDDDSGQLFIEALLHLQQVWG
jgi:hypothetical protein